MNVAPKPKEFKKEDSIGSILLHLRNAGWLPQKGRHSALSACLPALMVALDKHIDLLDFCESAPYKKRDISIVDILNSMANIGYVGRPAKVRIRDIDQRLFPCLFIPDNAWGKIKKPIVILGTSKDFDDNLLLSVFDGGEENKILIDARNRTFGTAYFFTDEEEVEDVTSQTVRKASGYSWFRALLERFRGVFWQVLTISVVLGFVSLATPLFVMMVYDKAISSHSSSMLAPLLMGVALALFCEWLLRSLRSYMLSWFSARLDNIVSNKIFEHLLEMPLIHTERASVASQIARLKSFETVRDFFNGPLFLAIIELPFTLIILGAIAFIAGYVAFVPIVTAVLYTILIFWVGPRLKTYIGLSSRASYNRQSMMLESLERMSSLRSSGLSDRWFSEFRKLSGKASLASFRARILSSIVEAIAHGLFIIAGMMTIILGIFKIWDQSMTAGALIASMIMVWRVLGPFQILCNSLPRFKQLQKAIQQLNRLMKIKTEYSMDDRRIQPKELKGQIEFFKVGLRYTRDTDPVFSGLTFDAEPGEIVAITGGNGSGKSTVLKLMCGLYRPQAGTIRFDGLDIRQIDPVHMRQNIAYIPQTPHFFRGTISENLRFAQPMVSDDILKVALHQADAWDEVCALPKGFDTIIGDRSSNLPLSLAYRLGLARAYIQDAPLMLFDELPYALLNSAAGDEFLRVLESWKGYRTVLMVTHREDYLKLADTVVLLSSTMSSKVGHPDVIIEEIRRRGRLK